MSATTTGDSDQGNHHVELLIGGRHMRGSDSYTLMEPYSGRHLADVQVASAEQVDEAVSSARNGHEELAALAIHERCEILQRAMSIVKERRETLATTVSRQTGKALRDTRREIDRSTYTLSSTVAAAQQIAGEIPSADAIPGGEGLLALVLREPLGVVAAITPFNAPFNLTVHKVAPAIAAGNSVIIKPAPQAPLSAFQLASILIEAGLPPAAISVIPGGPDIGEQLVRHPGVDAISFTGSRAVGLAISERAGLKRVVLELGGNSPNIVHDDADLDWAVGALVPGAYSNTGQSCNSVQRILVHDDCVQEFSAQMAKATLELRVGDPLDERTHVGTLVDERAAIRVQEWVERAVAGGARLLAGGRREGAILHPTLLTDVQPDMDVVCEEVFGPVASIIPYRTLDEAIALANSTPYGLQAAIFTSSLTTAFAAARRIRAGGVMINRSSNTRLDNLPFGGVKHSGYGREGARYTIEELSERKLVLIDATMTGAAHPLSVSPS